MPEGGADAVHGGDADRPPVLDVKVYYDNCLNGDMSADQYLAGVCNGIAKRLGIGPSEWLELRKLRDSAHDTSGSWFFKLLSGVNEFIWGDAIACNNGSGAGCFLMIANLLPGGAQPKPSESWRSTCPRWLKPFALARRHATASEGKLSY
ncbi:hypothetical protein AB0C28_41815 [Nonomuraea sp. NPDC048892]|uniref:hypothetical protein n=1 Tax=Nonomuraea sp. NPDC048892 TaxID=3154624 RepID=UPI0033CA022A